LVLSIVKGETSVAEAARKHGLKVAEVEEWRDRVLVAAENALRSRPRDEEALKAEEIRRLKQKVGRAGGRSRVAHIDEVLAARVERLIATHPTYGYRRLWALLRFGEGLSVNRTALYRVLKLKGWFGDLPFPLGAIHADDAGGDERREMRAVEPTGRQWPGGERALRPKHRYPCRNA
jgi:hypothetical protein